ncbi:MAG: beta-ketoacyl-ACP reductase [Thermoleophilia bacterium]
MSSELAGQVALVTGGVRGIGLAICEALIAEGVRVAAGYSRNGAAAEEFLAANEARGASIHQGTIEDHADCERVVEEVLDRHGRLDILVNNAGITMDRTVRKMSPEDWDHVLRVNLSGAFYMARAVIPHMVERRYGRIINISSVVGERGNIGQANYAASKSGLFGLTMTLALELANKDVTVNCVAPGFIETDMTGAVPEEILQRVIETIPARRLGRPDEVARVVRFLAEPASAYITGQVYSINGGLNM